MKSASTLLRASCNFWCILTYLFEIKFEYHGYQMKRVIRDIYLSCILLLRRYYKSSGEFCHSLTERSYWSYFCDIFVMILLPRKQIWIYLVPIDCEKFIAHCRYKDDDEITVKYRNLVRLQSSKQSWSVHGSWE